MFFLELITTKKCNQKCYYCNVWRHSYYPGPRFIEMDIDLLKHVIDSHGVPMMIELCGGEPGIISNLDEVVKFLFDHPKVKKIQVMSNGLVRLYRYDWLDKVIYNEHFIFDIDGTEIRTFYDNLELDFNLNNVIVTTERTTRSLLENWEYFQELGLFKSNFWFKLMNPKVKDIHGYETELKELFSRLGDTNSVNMIEGFEDKRNFDKERKLCAMNPPQPFFDFEEEMFGHCGTYLIPSRRFAPTKENFQQNLKCSLFNYEDYCKNCYTFDSGDKRSCIMDSLRGKARNRSFLK